MRNDIPNIIVDLTFQFAISIVEFTEILETKRKFNLANQLFRSGTSIGANVREAQNAESIKDFIHKMKIAAKEADETFYWLSLCKCSKNYPTNNSLIDDLQNIIKVSSKIIATTKKRLN